MFAGGGIAFFVRHTHLCQVWHTAVPLWVSVTENAVSEDRLPGKQIFFRARNILARDASILMKSKNC